MFVAPSDFQYVCERDSRTLVGVLGALVEVVTGHCKNGVNQAGGNFLSSLVFLFSALFPLPSEGPTLFCAIPPAWDRTIASFGPLILIVIVSLFSLLPSLFFLFSALFPLPP